MYTGITIAVCMRSDTSTVRMGCAHLQVIPEELVIELGNLELVSLFPVHDPGAALSLRVHQKWISGSPGHHDTILDTQVVCRQTL